MKAKKFVLFNGEIRRNCLAYINAIELTGKAQVTIAQTATKSARQRGLQHIWYSDIVNSGIGGERESTRESLDLACKWRWALPIWIRDDGNFASLFLLYSNKYKGDPAKMRYFVSHHVHTEQFTTSQMAEYMDEIHKHYSTELGVTLTDPGDLIQPQR
ncbi:MAG: hypothetical protein GY763_00320 [Gammaproteobacteria bacterium]|nr:hypothetical protein [Gammaproteobacteria bacterium]